jgi:hypothetical protein
VGALNGTLVANNVSGGVFPGMYAFQQTLGVNTTTQVGMPQTLSVYGGGYFSGNVGIGTTSPSQKLEVWGNLGLSSGSKIVDVTNPAKFILFEDGSGYTTLQQYTGYNFTAYNGAAYSSQFKTTAWSGASSGVESPFLFTPTIRQSGTAGYTALKLNVTEVSTGSGLNLLQDWQVGGVSKVVINNQGNVGIGTTAPDTSLEVNGPMQSVSSIVNHYYNVISFTPGAAGQTGTVKFTMPKYGSNTMLQIVIKGYDYSGAGAWQVTVSGYNYLDHNWYNTSVQFSGRVPFSSVRLGNDGTHDILLLGTTATTWTYGKIEIAEVLATHTVTTGWGTGWSATLLASESGFLNIVTLTPDMYTGVTGATTFVGAVNVPTPTTVNMAATKAYVDSVAAGGTLWTASGANAYLTNTAGNVGIGTTNPTSKFQINADNTGNPPNQLQIDGATNSGQQITLGYNTSGDYGAIQVIKQSVAYEPLALQPINGNVGIGTTAPGANLQINSVSGYYGSSDPFFAASYAGYNPEFKMYMDGAWNTNLQTLIPTGSGGSGNLILNTVGNIQLLGGNVGIGISPSYKLDVSGIANFSGQVLIPDPTGAHSAASKEYVDTAVTGGTSSGSLASLTVTPGPTNISGNWAFTGALQSDLNTNNHNVGTVNKLTVVTIDPVYNIGGVKYATYGPESIGIAVTSDGKGKLKKISNIQYPISNNQQSASDYQYAIDFGNAAKGSDLWLFWQTIDQGQGMQNITLTLTPEGEFSELWYALVPAKKEIVVHGNSSAAFSYHLSAPRYDESKWGNMAVDTGNNDPGVILQEK